MLLQCFYYKIKFDFVITKNRYFNPHENLVTSIYLFLSCKLVLTEN
jgi:hypothetical protein